LVLFFRKERLSFTTDIKITFRTDTEETNFMDIEGLAAIVTGGASGLGGATAEMLAGAGAKVTLFDMNAEAGGAHAERIGGRFVRVNVSEDEAVRDAVAEAEAAFGVARILVNCAGIAPASKTVGRGAAPHALDLFRRVIEVNLIGTFNVISKFAARLSVADPLGEERGVIVSTASVAAYEGQVGQAAYAASKSGVAGMTLPVARDLSQFGIRVCTIAPGIFWTPMLASMSQDVQDSLGKQVPFPSRLGKPEEYAKLVRSIIENPMLNGETIRLDGAIRMAPR
jgi:NAD(P)-dependent dehydrogenase (short-subunit alcohol dehydrogenase family)